MNVALLVIAIVLTIGAAAHVGVMRLRDKIEAVIDGDEVSR